jgi:hypothetical protein
MDALIELSEVIKRYAAGGAPFSRRGREGTHHRHARIRPLDMAGSGPKAILWPTGRPPPCSPNSVPP